MFEVINSWFFALCDEHKNLPVENENKHEGCSIKFYVFGVWWCRTEFQTRIRIMKCTKWKNMIFNPRIWVTRIFWSSVYRYESRVRFAWHHNCAYCQSVSSPFRPLSDVWWFSSFMWIYDTEIVLSDEIVWSAHCNSFRNPLRKHRPTIKMKNLIEWRWLIHLRNYFGDEIGNSWMYLHDY